MDGEFSNTPFRNGFAEKLHVIPLFGKRPSNIRWAYPREERQAN
jgi:hypothetical protein